MTITSAGLRAAYPEWTNAPDDVVLHAVSVANALPLDLYTSAAEETHRRYLEASAILYDHPYGRDLHKPDQATVNPYRTEAETRDRRKGTAYRAPGWTIPVGVS